MDKDTAVKILRESDCVCTGVGHFKIISPVEVELIADFIERQEEALLKINDIRNSIVGLQTINWSEHIYPLVAALNEAGIQGLGYPKSQKKFGTMLERTIASEAQVAVLREALGKVKLSVHKAHREKSISDTYYDLIIFGNINPLLESTPEELVQKVEELKKYAELGRKLMDAFAEEKKSKLCCNEDMLISINDGSCKLCERYLICQKRVELLAEVQK